MDLIGPTSHLSTPFLAVDAPTVRRNIAEMQSACDERGVALRPHIKTHKSSHYARAQLEAGAVGLTCATVSEAIGLGEAGVCTDLFIAVPQVVLGPKVEAVRRAAALHDRLLVAVDSARGMELLAGAALPDHVAAMVEIDSGLGRTGVDAAAVGDVVAPAPGLVAGLFTHGGHSYAPGRAKMAAADEVRCLADSLGAIGGAADPMIVSAGSTPTARLSAHAPVGEERPGTYLFGDRQQVAIGETEASQVAAVVVATVISTGRGRHVVDAGAKALTKDIQPWLDGFGEVVGHPQATVERVYDNHGVVVGLPDELEVGDRLAVIPNHICPVVNLFDEVVSVDGDEVAPVLVDLRGHLT